MRTIKKYILLFFVKLILSIPAAAQTKNDTIIAVPQFKPAYINTKLSAPLLPKNYYVNCLPFFCKKEWQIEKAIKFPLKFRIGSVEYCDKLEGKKN